MIKIAHYEVYIDRGAGWQLEDRFAAEQRQDAFNLAKEREQEKCKVKIIKEIFDVQDNSYQESVEYVSNLNKHKHKKNNSWATEDDEKVPNAPLPLIETPRSRNSVASALLKLVLLIVVSLIFANLFISLLFPVLEIFIPEDNSRPVLFGVFFVVFLAMSVPLLLKSIPWYVFMGSSKPRPIKEQKFYDRAEYLIRAYNLNSDKDPVVASAYPEAPLEYKQYIVSFLSELISHIQSPNAMLSSFSRFGLKLIVYGGCLELARYSGLNMPEANSVLFDALKIIDGDKADLEAFYEAKRTYRDNKIAVLMAGVGANLMSQVISGMPISENLLNVAFNKWESQDSNPQIDREPEVAEEAEEADFPAQPAPKVSAIDTLVSLKSDLKFMDDAMPNKEQTAADVSAQIHNIVSNLVNKYKGIDIVEAGGITTVRFRVVANAVKFALACRKDINAYHDEIDNDNMLMRNCFALAAYKPEEEPNLSTFWTDMFEHIYNNEVVMTADVKNEMSGTGYTLDFLGEKNFKTLNISQELYKIID